MDGGELEEQEPPSRELIDALRNQLEIQADQLRMKDRQIQELHSLLHQSLRKRRKISRRLIAKQEDQTSLLP